MALALVSAFFITRGLIAQPGFTDAFYHFNAANRLVSGQGLTDAYLWTYIGAPDSLPAPSHTYWMPLTSLSAALGMWLFNAPGSYAAAQVPFALMLAGTAGVGFWLGGRIGGTARHAWIAGLLTVFSGFYTRFWGATDTFAPYALMGSLCLVLLTPPPSPLSVHGEGGNVADDDSSLDNNRFPSTLVGRSAAFLAVEGLGVRGFLQVFLAGVFAALAHLTRADGVLLLLVAYAVILYPFGWIIRRSDVGAVREPPLRKRLISLAVLTAGYLLVMSPWFARNLNLTDSPLPVGGAQGIWFTAYDDLFNYPPDASAAAFFADDGLQRLIETRWLALRSNIGTFVGVEGWVVVAPLMLIGLWRRRRDAFLRGFWIYALGVHLVMTFVFPFPGYRGGLFHSAAALIPWWAALGVAGLDDAVDWIAKRRRRWQPGTAKWVFSAGLAGFALYLSLSVGLSGRVSIGTPSIYAELGQRLPADARVMANDPATLYYFTGLSGVVLPNEPPDVIPEIARRYDIEYLLLQAPAGTPLPLWPLFDDPPDWLIEQPLDVPDGRLYRIDLQTAPDEPQQNQAD
jgi:hypothetical protein